MQTLIESILLGVAIILVVWSMIDLWTDDTSGEIEDFDDFFTNSVGSIQSRSGNNLPVGYFED